jgi:RHS repeat-associated protein
LGLISKITPSNQSYFYHFDGIASTIGISDSSGNMVNKYAYDAFGKILNQEEGIPNPFKYVGGFGVMDEGNGLFYMRARFYDPEVGRFINKDPIGFAGGDFNLYAYVQNDPINFIDPLGLARVDWWKTYIQFAFSSSILFEGTTRSDEGIEQQTENYVNVIGGSLDIYIGSPPSPCYTTYEIGVGFSHLGIGYFFGNPDGSGNYQSWGVALHVGPAFSLFPAYINVTHPIRWLKIPMGPTYLGKAK